MSQTHLHTEAFELEDVAHNQLPHPEVPHIFTSGAMTLPLEVGQLTSTTESVPTREAGANIEGSFLDQPSGNEVELAPIDTGIKAWSFLAAAFMIEGLVWTVPFSYGIFLTAYLADPRFASNPHASKLLPLVGTLSSGLMYCTGPLVYPFFSRYPSKRRFCAWIGTSLCTVALLGASYAKNITQLLALQGVLYALGSSILYAACMTYLPEWFVVRRGLANGIIFVGSSAGGLIAPFVLPSLIHVHGTSKTLRLLSLVFAVSLPPSVLFLRPRLPETRVHGPGRRAGPGSSAYLRNGAWWAFVLANTVQAFGSFIPQLWFPTYAKALHLSNSSSSLALALLNGASALGPLVLGVLSDHISPWLLAVLTCGATSLVTFALWGGASHAAAGLMAYGVAYGLLAGGWTTLWSSFLRGFSKDDPYLSMSMYGFFMLSRGIGNVLSSPISTTLSSVADASTTFSNGRTGFTVEGGRFEKLIVYVGSCFAIAAIATLVGWGGERAGRIRS
ncbi:major facilitator superfamily domain-containing protein [Gloeopeniophorella convolvens]|nr:major facilitator superfamily domain-containing protein [Gloeopeniophorella convolvens]